MKYTSDTAAGQIRDSDEFSPAAAKTAPSALGHTVCFMRRHWPKVLLISAFLLAPCLWHQHIEAGDLGSHLYNAWLVQLIQHGQAPGLSVTHQWNNVLFDWFLSSVSAAVGFQAAEKISVSVAVLIFFWSVFALLCAASRRIPWALIPCVAMLTYGWTFHTGLFNYYISLALSFLVLAIFWRGKPWERLLAVALAPLVLLAHPIGLAWLLGTAVCVWVAETMPPRYHLALPIATGIVLLLVHHYLFQHFRIEDPVWSDYLINGTDQFVLFGQRYSYLAGGLLLFGLACFVADIVRSRRERRIWLLYSIPFQLYLCAQVAIMLLPRAVYLPQYAAPFSMIVERVSLISATMACCVLATMRPRKWHAYGFAAFAAVFFVFLYQDTAFLNSMEDRVTELVRTLPPGQRVMETIAASPDWRAYVVDHMLDRACIGQCLAFGNYEPASDQFRVRAEPGNHIVMTSYLDTESMEDGIYTVRAADLPAYQVYQCSPRVSNLCIRELQAGETNNRLGVQPQNLVP